VSALGDDAERQNVVETLTRAEGFLRGQLGRRLENLRSIPRLHFELDESIAYGVRVSTLLRDIEAERPVEAAVEGPE
jgi:ribosome-binding factor A